MTLRKMVTAGLLVFAGAAVVYVLLETVRPQVSPATGAAAGPADRVDAYYFHGRARCQTCRNLETYGQEALRRGFGPALEDGRLVWRPTNVDLPENRHYVQDFQLRFRSLVLVEVRDGKPARWKNLEGIWPLAGDREACMAYIEEEARRFMEAR
ncbi:MAG: nitrophenyl compound nitroreductase subunit ArsF family protein [Gemmatimonadota bacterium]